MKGFAYLDKHNILHCNTSKETALKYSINGKVVETTLCDEGGYMNENGMNVHIDGNEFWHGKNKNRENMITESAFAQKYPQTYAVYQKLK